VLRRINQYLPEYPLDGLLRDSLLRSEDEMEDTERPNFEHAGQIVDMAARWHSRRRLFISSTGKMGLAPLKAEIGDLIGVSLCLLQPSHPPL
jgi:hypothetical protein